MSSRKAFNILAALSGLFHSTELAGSQKGRIFQFSMKAHRCRYSLQMWDTVVYAFSARSARAFTSEYIDIQQRESCNECEQLGTEAVCQCCALWLYYIIMQLRHWKFATKMSHIDQHTDAVFRWRQPCSIPPPFLWAKMSITSDEVNFLVYRYLQESGWSHLYLPEAVMACDTHTCFSQQMFFLSPILLLPLTSLQ